MAYSIVHTDMFVLHDFGNERICQEIDKGLTLYY